MTNEYRFTEAQEGRNPLFESMYRRFVLKGGRTIGEAMMYKAVREGYVRDRQQVKAAYSQAMAGTAAPEESPRHFRSLSEKFSDSLRVAKKARHLAVLCTVLLLVSSLFICAAALLQRNGTSVAELAGNLFSTVAAAGEDAHAGEVVEPPPVVAPVITYYEPSSEEVLSSLRQAVQESFGNQS
ncbi:MAG: hypothetical protein WDA00_00385 [Eubacteriales bacterium]